VSYEVNAATVAARKLATISRRVGASLALDETLEAVANAVVETLGFRAAVVNLPGPDGDMHVVAVAGGEEVRRTLQGSHAPRSAWDAMLAAATPWGELRFLHHDTKLPAEADHINAYVPPLPVPSDDMANGWHPLDALCAPLLAANGDLLGVLSVDDPVDGQLPNEERRALLEAYAVQAALAIEHARVHQAVRDTAMLLGRLFDESPIGKVLFGPDGAYMRVNQAYCTFMGHRAEEFIGRHAVDFAHPEERASTEALSHEIRDHSKRLVKIDRRYLHKDGYEIWGRLSLTRISTAEGECVLAAIEDITEARIAEAQLRHHALHDSLTGLPNRTLIFDRLGQALARARRNGTDVGVVVLDVDHFKQVNDSYGHPAGDQLLICVTDALQQALRESDTAGRLGGDEFIVVCENAGGSEAVAELAERLRIAVRQPMQIGAVTLLPSISLGCTVADGSRTVDELIAEADAGLYGAKAAGRGRVVMFDEEMRQTSYAQLEIRAELEVALERDELRLHYQPIVELPTGRVLGYEALLRWNHPTRGLLSPIDFLSVIADGDLDLPVTQWVLRRACQDIARLTTDDWAPYISVNLSARQLSRMELADDVMNAARDAGLPIERLWLELTEEHLVDRRHRPVLETLHALGCRIALDDFGTGYSGLTYLQQLPVDALKIDRSYVSRICTDPVSAGITTAVADLACVLGLAVVAEGVETHEEAAALAAMGIRVAQGYLYGRPRAISDLGGPRVIPNQRETAVWLSLSSQ
jgi:diguanylate cyclase (GGDEF)-like protein/PAS domain S-box-containing protein